MAEPTSTAAIVATTAATVATAGVTATQLGADPLPWVIGAAGAAIAFLLRSEPTSAKVALGHGAISVLCGGLGAPFLASVIAHRFDPVYANDLVLAAALSIGWPWIVPLGMGWLSRVFGGLPLPKSGGQ